MRFLSTRGGETTDALTVCLTGLAADGGLYVPDALPESVDDFTARASGSPERAVSGFFSLYFPDLPELAGSALVEAALARLAPDGEETRPALTEPLNPYNRFGQLMRLDRGPSGTAADVDLAFTTELIERLLAREGTCAPLYILPVVTGDEAVALLQLTRDTETPILLILPADGSVSGRADEMAALMRPQVTAVRSALTAPALLPALGARLHDPAFRERAAARGYCPVAVGPVHPMSVFAFAALFTAAAGELSADERLLPNERLDVMLARGNMTAMAGLAYASVPGLPVNRVSIGEFNARPFYNMIRLGEFRLDEEGPDADAVWPLNLERLLYEITGRDSARLAGLMRDLADTGRMKLSEDEREALRLSLRATYSDEKNTVRNLTSLYDRTDYLVDEDLIAACCENRNDRISPSADRPTLYVSQRSPLLNPHSARQVLGCGDKLSDPPTPDDYAMLAACAGLAFVPTLAGKGGPVLEFEPLDGEGALDAALIRLLGDEGA